MATTSAQLERETEEARARVERTLDELRGRISPGQLLDQATDYLRNSSGRAFFGNLRDQVVANPLPVTLIGAGIAWLAISGAIGRRGNGHRYSSRGDWGDTTATAEDLAHSGRDAGYRPRHASDSAADLSGRARATAEGWASRARETAEGVADRARDAAEGMADRAGDTAEDWIDETRDTLSEAGERLHETAEEAQHRASRFYDKTVGKARHAAGDGAHYAATARHRIADSGDALMNFCREQPMLVAGIGVALGAALGAMLPTTRPERQVMGDASRDVQEKAADLAAEQYERAKKIGGDLYDEAKARASEELERGLERTAEATGVDRPSQGTTEWRRSVARESGQRGGTAGNEPQSAAPYAEAAEAGSAGESERARPAESPTWTGQTPPANEGRERG